MISLRAMRPEDMPALFEVCKLAEPYAGTMNLEQFKLVMDAREGWTVMRDEEVAGCVSISDFIPGLSAVLHVFTSAEIRSRWCTKSIVRTVFRHCFFGLELPRVGGFSIDGLSSDSAPFLDRLGFKLEGITRRGALVNGRLHDVLHFGMLREECRWL